MAPSYQYQQCLMASIGTTSSISWTTWPLRTSTNNASWPALVPLVLFLELHGPFVPVPTMPHGQHWYHQFYFLNYVAPSYQYQQCLMASIGTTSSISWTTWPLRTSTNNASWPALVPLVLFLELRGPFVPVPTMPHGQHWYHQFYFLNY